MTFTVGCFKTKELAREEEVAQMVQWAGGIDLKYVLAYLGSKAIESFWINEISQSVRLERVENYRSEKEQRQIWVRRAAQREREGERMERYASGRRNSVAHSVL